MKKKIVLMILSLFLMVGIKSVNAEYTVTMGSSSGNIYFYDTKFSDGHSYMTYCLDPLLAFRSANNKFDVKHKIDPKASVNTEYYEFDLAATYVYQYLQSKGWTSTSNEHRVIGTEAFRLITEKYLPARSAKNTQYTAGFGDINAAVSGNDFSRVAPEAAQIYKEAVKLVESGKSYDELIKNGFLDDGNGIWDAQWDVMNISKKYVRPEVSEMYIELVAKDSLTRINYESFTVTSKNSSLNGKITTKSSVKVREGVVGITIEINENGWDQKSLDLVVQTSYCDERSAATQLYLLSNLSETGTSREKLYYQRMIIVGTGSCSIDVPPIIEPPSFDIPEEIIEPFYFGDDKCVCDSSTGEYIYTKYDAPDVISAGYPKKWYEGETTPNGVDINKCPGSCLVKGDICSQPSVNKNTWICADLEGNDGIGELCTTRRSVKDGAVSIEDQWNLECWYNPPSRNPNDPNNPSNPTNRCEKPDVNNPDSWVCDDPNVTGTEKLCKDRDEVTGHQSTIEELWDKECANPEKGKQKCECDESKGEYNYFEWDNTTSTWSKKYNWKVGTSNPSEVDMAMCPNTCPLPKAHSCEQSSESSTGYFCKESSQGAGDGQECTKDEFQKQCECPELEDKCNQGDDPSCEEYENKCITCVPQVTIPSDCSELHDSMDLFGSTYLNGKISDITKEKTACNNYKVNNAKACVIGKTDASNNSYESKTTFDSSKVSTRNNENKYCKVWCEESYDFGLPTAKRTQSGGYFTLEMKISDTRTCYTSSATDPTKPIDTALFEKDLDAKLKEVVNEYNEYLYWDAAVNAPLSANSGTKTEGPGVCYTTRPDGTQVSERTGATTTYNYIEIHWSAKQYDEKGNQIADRIGEYKEGTASCSCSSCTKTDGIDQRSTTYTKNRDAAAARLRQKIAEYQAIVAEYNSCSGDMSGVSGWVNDIQFNPEVSFSYNEGYLNKGDQMGLFYPVGSNTLTTKSMYCNGDTNSAYECLGTEATVNNDTTNDVPDNMKGSIKKFVCKETSGVFTCGLEDIPISIASWVKKEVTAENIFKPQTNFSTYVQYGTVQKNVTTGLYELYTPLPKDAFPISLIQKTGVYPFTITFNNIGQSNVDGSLGRLIGKNNDILTAYNNLDASLKCDIDGNINGNYTSASTNSGYVCHYVNNCDDCDFKCKDDGSCEFDDTCTGSCTYTCKNCLFDGNNTNFTYRSVSLNNLFPNSRPVGGNWNNNLKSQATIQEIEADGESIYDKPQYSYTLTPANLSAIRNYNKAAGVYTNTTIPSTYASKLTSDAAVYCDTEEFNGTNYSVRCRSGFLDLIENDNTLATKNDRITSEPPDGEGDDAWVLFSEHSSCLNGSCFTKGLGPSWKIEKRK